MKLLWPENLHFWLTKKLPCKQFHLQKYHRTKPRSFLFQMNRDNSGNSINLIWLTNILSLLLDDRKEEIIRSMNLINGFGARGYLIRGYIPPNSPFNIIVCNV